MTSFSRAKARETSRKKRHSRIRSRVRGTSEYPRLVVHRSLKNINGQLVDDISGRTLIGVSTLESEVKSALQKKDQKISASRVAGKILGEKAVNSGITKVVFDRGGYSYHGRVKAFAEGAREGGLKF